MAEVHRQLLVTCQQLKFRMNREPAEYSSIHKAILSGAISQVACHQEGKVYQEFGIRNSCDKEFCSGGEAPAMDCDVGAD